MNPRSYAAYQAQLTGDEPVPYLLTAKAEAVLGPPEAGDPEAGNATWAEHLAAGLDLVRWLKHLAADPEAAAEWEAEAADEWDSADSNAYQARVEAGLEPEAEP